MQENHDLADNLLLGPGIRDALGAEGANVGALAKRSGSWGALLALQEGFDDVGNLVAKSRDHFLRIDRLAERFIRDYASPEVILGRR